METIAFCAKRILAFAKPIEKVLPNISRFCIKHVYAKQSLYRTHPHCQRRSTNIQVLSTNLNDNVT